MLLVCHLKLLRKRAVRRHTALSFSIFLVVLCSVLFSSLFFCVFSSLRFSSLVCSSLCSVLLFQLPYFFDEVQYKKKARLSHFFCIVLFALFSSVLFATHFNLFFHFLYFFKITAWIFQIHSFLDCHCPKIPTHTRTLTYPY